MPQYSKLCTEFYDIDKPEPPPDAFDFYLQHAERAAGPILEAMCGSGRFLLPLLKRGFDIEGADVSPHMLSACREKARALGLVPTLHAQALEELETERQFALVFIPASSFSLITDLEKARRALQRIHAALLPSGRLVVEVERALPRPSTQSGSWGGRWVERADGAKILISWLGQYSAFEGIARSLHRYELVKDGRLLELEFEDFELRYYALSEFRTMLESAGFSNIKSFTPYTDAAPAEEASEGDEEGMLFECSKAS